jgi:hypothetical protein
MTGPKQTSVIRTTTVGMIHATARSLVSEAASDSDLNGNALLVCEGSADFIDSLKNHQLKAIPLQWLP